MTKVLVVEDEGIVSLDIKISLESLGYEVMTAHNGEEAMNIVKKKRPDIVLMDIYLQGKKEGIEIARKIKEKYNIPVIYLTAYADDEIIEEAKETGPFAYLLKPLEEREIHSAIQIALYKHKLERELKEKEEKLKEELEFIKAIIKSIYPDTLAVIGKNRIIEFISEGVREILGYEPEELIGNNTLIVYPSEDEWKKFGEEFYKIIEENDYFRGTVKLRRKDGRTVEVFVTASPLRHSHKKGVVIVLRNKT